MKDYVRILKTIYDPKNYYRKATSTCLYLKPANKYKPGMIRMGKTIRAFSRVCRKVGFRKTTGWLYWKMLFTVLIKNPRALGPAVNLVAMFIHFNKQSKFIIRHTNKKIKTIERAMDRKTTIRRGFKKRAVQETA